jgi:hypothetical protein
MVGSVSVLSADVKRIGGMLIPNILSANTLLLFLSIVSVLSVYVLTQVR